MGHRDKERGGLGKVKEGKGGSFLLKTKKKQTKRLFSIYHQKHTDISKRLHRAKCLRCRFYR